MNTWKYESFHAWLKNWALQRVEEGDASALASALDELAVNHLEEEDILYHFQGAMQLDGFDPDLYDKDHSDGM